MKFKTACHDRHAGKSAVKCLSERHNRMTQVSFERDHVDHNHGALNPSTTLPTFCKLFEMKMLHDSKQQKIKKTNN